ncbi:hypothetical protein EW145_g4039 [Phellinidium pouzarii]|uniref:Glucose receptor Git3 N-terminal domain-containing protein n=1 Tax=Phellinidium pouzarii TaxID=167371 RepID=A0A4S4L6S6_9AGAM|nr:hypothetical protein EW145_g4039 [Phellinidium pouzarii]
MATKRSLRSSELALYYYYCLLAKRFKTYHPTNITPYFISLLLANVLQAIATILNVRWVHDGIVFDGGFCSFQGGLKNVANVGTALWSFVIAAHVFNLLFLRWHTTRASLAATLVGGWSAVLLIVAVGPIAIETPELGPYFGVSGYWCWITEYFFVAYSVIIIPVALARFSSFSGHRIPLWGTIATDVIFNLTVLLISAVPEFPMN